MASKIPTSVMFVMSLRRPRLGRNIPSFAAFIRNYENFASFNNPCECAQ